MRRTHDHNRIAAVLIANPTIGHKAIAKLTGVPRTVIWKVARERGIRQRTVAFPTKILAANEAKILKLLAQGATYGVIAAVTGLSPVTVSKVARNAQKSASEPCVRGNTAADVETTAEEIGRRTGQSQARRI